ncbi:C-GCAxxG-C-C family protein [Heliobacterium chlorum]|uniref:C-GCAxxG-C-C family protein n=2 Tax=Heliobacterium chlorum TaxID=2698 RepID=A0ABR7T9Y2_HELCL|nr:C-GCAxxG-C-C family protein [Heliobacterium chlorum]
MKSKVVEKSVQYFKEGLYCSEAILKAFNEEYNLGLNDEFMRIATGFGAGLGASKCLCGSLTGGVMVLSVVKGRKSADESEAPSFESAAKLHDEFRREFNATCCRVLTRPVEWGTPEHHQYCVQFVEKATELTEEILSEGIQVKKNLAI